MAKNSLYKKLVRKFKSTISNYQNVNAEFDFTKIEKIISNQKKDKRYYTSIQQFLVYLRKFKDKNELNFISNKSREKYQRSLEKLESLLIATLLEKETSFSATAVKKSNLKSLVMQPFLTMIFLLKLFNKQTVTARPLEASRKTRSTNNCVIKGPHCYQYNDNLDMTVYQNDLQKSAGFSELLKRKQSIEFSFKDTIFILSENCLSRQSLAKNPQSLCHTDYVWFLQSMAIYHIRRKVRAEARNQGLSLNETDVAQITQDICSIDPTQQNARQLLGIYSHDVILEKISESKLEQFFFNAKYLPNEFQSTFPEGNSGNLVSRINQAVRRKITDLKLESEESNAFTSLNRDNYSRPLPETQSAISGVLQTDINTPSSISHRSAEGFNWMIIVPVAIGGIGIIVFIVAIVIWYSKKNRSENSGSATEHKRLLKSVEDPLHVQEIAGRLDKRLEFLKELDSYEGEIRVHHTSFFSTNDKEKAIEDLKKIQEALTKFLETKKTSNKNKDKILSNKLKSALLIVDSLIQRYNLLSLPMHNSSENDYITDQLKSALTKSINLMLINIEFIRDNYKGPYKTEKDELEYFGFLISLEKVVYDAMLSAHAEEYFVKYSQEQIKACLEVDPNTKKDSQECELPKPNTNTKDSQECELQKIKNLQNEALSTLKIIKDSGKNLATHLSKLNETNLYRLADSIVTQSDSMTYQLLVYFTHYNTRREILNKKTQASAGSVSSTLFKQSESPKRTNLSRKCTM